MGRNSCFNYTPSKTGRAFMLDKTSIVKGLMGPVGSGKSVCCVMDCFIKAISQAPNKDGVRKTRVAVVRNTYPELRTTTIKTFEEWIPPSICHISKDPPFIGNVHGSLDDGTTYQSEFVFLALDREEDAHRLLSLEYTFAWINEAKQIDGRLIPQILQRTGRYPRKVEAPTTWAGIIMDTNPPDTDHWYYKMAEVDRPQNYAFYRQPGGIMLRDGQYVPNPDAENIDHLPLGYDYYLRQCVAGTDPNMIKVMLMGEYGTLGCENPVFPGFSESLHVKNNIPVIRNNGTKLLLTFDFGLTPACLFCQVRYDGQLRVLREFYNDNCGLRQFLETEILPALMSEEFRNIPLDCVCDPAGVQRAQVDDTLTAVSELIRHGIPARPGKTNEFLQRKSAVDYLLARLVSKGEPALIVDRRCSRLIKGFISGYFFKKREGADGIPRESPEKNRFSHVHDALQYAAMEVSVMTIREEEERRNDVIERNMHYDTGESASGWGAFV